MLNKENVKTIADLVREAGQVHGERIFVRYEKEDRIKEMSFQNFYELCKAVAGWTEEKNKENGYNVRIGIFGGSSRPFLTALFGVMSNGNVAAPLDIQLNMASLSDCINRADLDYLFYDWEYNELAESVKELCPNLKGNICLQNRKHVYCVQNIWNEYADGELKSDINPKDCAMILFTSGTTGKSKGVMLSHENLIDNTFSTDFDKHEPDEICLNVLPVHHVFCIHGDFLLTLKDGNVICLNQDMMKLGAHLQLFQPTTIAMVPMIAKSLYNKIAILQKQYPDKDINEIKAWVFGKQIHKIACGGGYLAPDLAAHYREMGILIGQGYGMTECSPKISAADFSRQDKAASVGKIVGGCEVRILDGEIQVKSPSVMMGYYKDPEETAKSITEDGWLRTGDMGYFDEEGFLFFTGRCKNLIVLSNGENVAPEQLENLFEDENLIEDILVFGENDKICAEVYPNLQLTETLGIEDVEKAVTEIVQKHNQDLPSYKRILQTYVRYIPFEKTASKKIIREKYFEQKAKQKEVKSDFKKPETERQKIIFESVAGSLGHHNFGIDTDLFEAGIDSLGCVMLLSDFYEKLQISISLQELSEHPTIEALDSFATEKQASQVDYSVREVYPLTGTQTYFGYILRGNTTSNLPFLFKLDASVDLEKLQAAVEQVFEVHPEIKAVIQATENGALACFRDDAKEIHIPIIEMSDAEWDDTKGQLIQPFMYTENEPLFHAGIYKTECSAYLFFDLAHIMGDGMSINILFEDINAIYNGKAPQKQSYTMYEYALDEMDRKQRGVREECIAYFQKQTENLKIKRSILARKDSQNLEKGITGVIQNNLTGLTRKKVQIFCKKYNVSENVFFLTAFNYCVSVFANEDDVVVSSTHSGRTNSRWYNVVGPLYMTYYHRYTRVPHETVPELLQKSANQILRTMDKPVSNIRADEMFFQYQGEIMNINEIGNAPAEIIRLNLDATPFHLQVMADDKGYFYELRYWENRYERKQLEIFMNCYKSILQAMMIEKSVRRLKYYIEVEDKPLYFYTEAGKINEEAGYDLIPDVSPDTRVKVYVFDVRFQKKPFGGWGDLYIMDYPTKDYVDKVASPYEDGVLYQTGRTARITYDGRVEFLEDAGRMVMLETLRGRVYVDLLQVEGVLCECEGVTEAQAYTYYGGDNVLLVGADVAGIDEQDFDRIKAYAAERLQSAWVPTKLVPVSVNLSNEKNSHADLKYHGIVDLKVTPRMNGNDAIVRLQAYVADKTESQTVHFVLKDADGNVVAETSKSEKANDAKDLAKNIALIDLEQDIRNVCRRNDSKDSYLYIAEAELIENDVVIDTFSMRFGC